MDFNDDEHLDVCQNIEVGLRQQYEVHPELTDLKCMFALENAKVAIKKNLVTQKMNVLQPWKKRRVSLAGVLL